jgi:hypothetical protein
LLPNMSLQEHRRSWSTKETLNKGDKDEKDSDLRSGDGESRVDAGVQ